jgi:hypothetical protein
MTQAAGANFLVAAAFADSTRQRYSTAVKKFETWLEQLDFDLPDDPDQLDDLVTEYLHSSFERRGGVGKGEASQLVHGLAMVMPKLRHKLPIAKLALRGWQNLRPAQPHPPISWPLTVLVAVSMAMEGDVLAAVATLVSFDALLRVGELVGLVREDVVVPGDDRLGCEHKDFALRLRRTKTGVNKWATVPNLAVQQLLSSIIAGLAPKDKVFPFSAAVFRQRFKSHCARLGLCPGFVPHSLRHGSATKLYLEKVPLFEILVRSRWAVGKSAEHYVQQGRALLLDVQTPRDALLAADALAADLLAAFSLAQSHGVEDGMRRASVDPMTSLGSPNSIENSDC